MADKEYTPFKLTTGDLFYITGIGASWLTLRRHSDNVRIDITPYHDDEDYLKIMVERGEEEIGQFFKKPEIGKIGEHSSYGGDSIE